MGACRLASTALVVLFAMLTGLALRSTPALAGKGRASSLGVAYGLGISEPGDVRVTDDVRNVVPMFEEGSTPEKPVTEPAEVTGASAKLHGTLRFRSAGNSWPMNGAVRKPPRLGIPS
jgi:hypothetical protein